MESISLILIVVGAAIIAVVFLLRLGLRRRDSDKISMPSYGGKGDRMEEPEFDPLFAIDAKREEVSDSALAEIGRVTVEQAPRAMPPSSRPVNDDETASAAPSRPSVKRRPPRMADDPHRVVVLNVMAHEGQSFCGEAVRRAVQGAGLEYGEWQIFHYYPPAAGDAPPLFSLTNMVKPGSFDLQRMDAVRTPGLSLFMVPAGVEGDTDTFDTMLATARRLAANLGGEVRDARRSVLTRQAIEMVREQLNEWRCKAQMVYH